MDPDLEELPTDYLRGLDFRISKGTKGGFADYSSSKWARKESALTEAEQEAIEKYGLFDLSSFLPKRPTEVELNVMKEMFEASVDGQSYDTERWGQYFRPAGLQAPAGSSQSNSVPSTGSVSGNAADDEEFDTPKANIVTKASSFDEDDDVPVASAPVKTPAASSDKAQDILALIRSRQKA
jgi:hypothetical protein